MKGLIDFHTHAFPDILTEKAIGLLEKEGGVPARLDGTDQGKTLELFKSLGLPSHLEMRILRENALALLSSV